LGQFVLKIGLGTIIRKRYSDPECGFRVLSRRAMDVMDFKGKGFSVEAEMILSVLQDLKRRIEEVPITCIYGNGKTQQKIRSCMELVCWKLIQG